MVTFLDWDERRRLIIPGNKEETIRYCINHWIETALHNIQEKGAFFVALSGGSTPLAIYHGLAEGENRDKVDWSRVFLFWSDERSVPYTHGDSNYRAAMEAGLNALPIPSDNIFPVPYEENKNDIANIYENAIRHHVPNGVFDFVMLGMGEDGHTASLFPHSEAIHATQSLVVSTFVQSKNSWRISLTFDCINAAKVTAIYIIGASKAAIVKRALTEQFNPEKLPIQAVGTPKHPALWILDNDAASDVDWTKGQ